MLFRSDRKSTRLNSSHTIISYAVFCLKKKRKSQHHVGQHVDRGGLLWACVLRARRSRPAQPRSCFAGARPPCSAGLCLLFFFNDTATTEIYTLSLHDALPI